MKTTAKVILFGSHVASVAWDEDRELGIFEYHPAFLGSGIEIAPLTMPLGSGRFSFPDLPRDSFKGLPGLLADSLPDKFGNLLIDRWLAEQGRTPESFDPVERLCYLGSRAMGALEFEPTLTPGHADSELDVAMLVELANRVLASREELDVQIDSDGALAEILRVGTSAGGARAKAIVAWNARTGELRSGQLPLPQGFEPWLMKFDGVSGNRDKERPSDPQGYGRIEFAYHLMARAAGIKMNECRLLEEHGRAHFMTRRFDRTEGGKLHLQTLCGLAHMDFNQAGAYSYEQAFQLTRQLGLPHPDSAGLYRRAVFNIVARNQDDHTKNVSFLMDRGGNWRLAPAYDVIYSYNPDGTWTSRHQMALAGKRDDFTREDLLGAAPTANLKAREARAIVAEVVSAVQSWREFAADAGVTKKQAVAVAEAQRANL